jgi:hypothetical protein
MRTQEAIIEDHQKLAAVHEAVFGTWEETGKRKKGVIEELNYIQLMMRWAGVGLGVLVLHALGVPTQEVFGLLSKILAP